METYDILAVSCTELNRTAKVLMAVDIKTILAATIVIGAIGLLIALMLGIAAIKFLVKKDDREEKIREVLPGNNCGGCGYAGCDALAQAITLGNAPANACPVGGAPVGEKVAAIMGVSVGSTMKRRAFVKCSGTCDKTGVKSNYYGISDCTQAAVVPGSGDKSCEYGCMGLGSCVKQCKFDAIHIIDGVAVVDKDKCTACGMCVNACPKNLIEIIPASVKFEVACSNKQKGQQVMKVCETGCIGCGICVKSCASDAVVLENNLAHINHDECVSCGICANKCPKKVIKSIK